MTDKELLKQVYEIFKTLVPTKDFKEYAETLVRLRRALGVSVDLAERLQKPEKTNQCAETCARAKLCAVCGVSLNQEPVAWFYTNAQGKTLIVESSVAPRVDAVPLYSYCTPPKPMMDHAGIRIKNLPTK